MKLAVFGVQVASLLIESFSTDCTDSFGNKKAQKMGPLFSAKQATLGDLRCAPQERGKLRDFCSYSAARNQRQDTKNQGTICSLT